MNDLKPIPGLESYYSATKDGRIYSHRQNDFMHPSISKNGYNIVRLCLGSLRPCFKVSRLVAATYLDLNLSDRLIEVDHGLLGKLNDSIDNLSLLSHYNHTLKHCGRLGIDDIDHKMCARCKIVKSKLLFHKNKNLKDGLHSYCKTCRNKRTW